MIGAWTDCARGIIENMFGTVPRSMASPSYTDNSTNL